jgi:RNA polymerase sigma factor (sigma-70 family)
MESLKEELAKEYNNLYELALKITKGKDIDAQDLTQEIYIILYEYDEQKIRQIYDNGHLKYWVARVMLNQYIRTNSPFKKKHYIQLKDDNAIIKDLCYDDSSDAIDQKILFEQRLAEVYEVMEDLHHYDKNLFQVYYQSNKSIRALASATGISTTSIFNTLKNVRNYIKDEIKD